MAKRKEMDVDRLLREQLTELGLIGGKSAGELSKDVRAEKAHKIGEGEEGEVSRYKYIEPWDRALRFLVAAGHTIGDTEGKSITIDGKAFLIRELPGLVDRLHHDAWLTSEKAFVRSLLGPPD